MQRNSFILRNIILPNIFPTPPRARPTSFSTFTQSAKSQVQTEIRPREDKPNHQSATTVAWSSEKHSPNTPFQRVLGHDPPTRMPTSRGGSESGGEEGRWTTAQRRTRMYLGLEGSGRSSQAETSAMALQRILQAYNVTVPPTTSGTAKGKGKERVVEVESSFQSVSNGDKMDQTVISPRLDSTLPRTPRGTELTARSAADLSNPDDTLEATTKTNVDQPLHTQTQTLPQAVTTTITKTRPTQFPPLISRLLDSRLYRLSVFHILSTPEYATNPELLQKVAEHLELSGAGKLAKRLRRGLDVSLEAQEQAGESGSKGKIRLWSDSKCTSDSDKLPPNHWSVPQLPPCRPSPDASRQRALTEYYNSHLLHLLTRPSTSTPTANHLPTNANATTKLNDWPAPTPSLRQLRKLLETISKLEKHRGFVPDANTANIIIRCWLRCATVSDLSSRNGDEDEHEGRLRRYKDKNGQVRVVRKTTSEKTFGNVEIRALFDIVSKAMSKSLVTRQRFDGDGEKEWREVVRPFGKMVIKALREKGDTKGVEKVRDWLEKQRKGLTGGKNDGMDEAI
ncbi:hypothetical protein CI109_103845 [Kwoniella shandongensis]|uniref:Uncharacterized protein n=1 Tax=Kwoniella shandongensis TaxID=1734106 RepID=A0A5M6CCQ0_9TREE|nr:uncharacterized protein CI109_000459 [Kwoniella shandongensis]KAA5530889.1 hypothetical protein CI109_000459 [Kwoniella shandongensis]